MTPRRGDTASLVAAEWARTRPSPGAEAGNINTLVLGDPSPLLARALDDSGHAVTRWHRSLTPGQLCTPWPPAGPFHEVWVRMPRSSLEAAMLLHAAAARIANRGAVLLFGAGDEGIRSAARHFPEGTDPPRAVLIKRRCRVLVATRQSPPPRPDGLDSWKTEALIDWGAGARPWTFYPGVFAHGRLDPATALLIDAVPNLPADARVLDFGAGTGIIGAAVLERAGPGTRAQLLDPDVISLAAAARNVPAATPILGSGISAVQGPFDLIASNPPIHAGSAQSLRTVALLAREAPGVLAEGGRLILVAQRRLPADQLLQHAFGSAETIADGGPFRVWSATARRGRSARRRP